MATPLTDIAEEESTYIITCTFRDEDDDLVTPNAATITWCLMDSKGNIINSRTNVAIASLSIINIVLSGDDLAIQTGETGEYVSRKLLVKAVFDSDVGNDLPLKSEAVFPLENLTGVS